MDSMTKLIMSQFPFEIYNKISCLVIFLLSVAFFPSCRFDVSIFFPLTYNIYSGLYLDDIMLDYVNLTGLRDANLRTLTLQDK
jgi:hypothetical protein